MHFHVLAKEQPLTEDRVRGALRHIDPQAHVAVDEEAGLIEVHSMMQPERLAAAIRDAGYRLESVSPTA